MSAHDSYAQLHAKQRSQEPPRSRSPVPVPRSGASVGQLQQFLSDLNSKASKTQLQEVSLKLAEAQAKILSLTNIVKLVQKYTQTQDMQYQQQRQSLMNRQATLNTMIADQQRRMDKEQHRMFELSELYTQYRQELNELKKLQTVASAEYLKSHVESQRTFKFDSRDVLREIDAKDMIKGAEERLRMELNRKIEICMDQLRNVPTRREFEALASDMKTGLPSFDGGREGAAVARQIETIKHTLESLVSSRASPAKSKSKPKGKQLQKYHDYVKQSDLIQFRQEIDLKLRHIVDKFSQVVKRYVGKSVSPTVKRTENTTIERSTLRKDEVSEIRENTHPNISDYNTNKHRGNQQSRSIKAAIGQQPRKKSASLPKRKGRDKSRSKSRSRSRSQSVSKHSHKSKKSDNSQRPQHGIVDKRKQKQQQLREMMRKAKEQRKQKDKKVRVL